MTEIEHPANFLLQTDDGKLLQTFLLDTEEITIGRASTCKISIPMDKLISRRHATLSYREGKYILRDIGSSNGTFINDNLLEVEKPYLLHNGDIIHLGRHQLLFQADASVSPALPDQPTRLIVSGPLDLDTAKAEIPGSRVLTLDQLRFSSFYPQEVAVGTWTSLLVYAHLEQAIEEIYHDASGFKQEVDIRGHKTSGRNGQFLLQSANITIIPECKGVTFNPKRITFQWLEDWHRVEFRFAAKKELAGLNCNGRISIFAGPLLIGTLRLACLVDDPQLILQEREAAVTTKIYTKTFASYSPEDELIGQQCRAAYTALGLQASLEADAKRKDTRLLLRHSIEAAEVFQLFWSARTARAASVEQEVAYALQLNRGEGFIRPVYWSVPRVPVPAALNNISFTYLPLYTFTSSSP